MADGKEEAVDLDVKHLLFVGAFEFHKLGTLHAIFAKEAESVAVEENLDILFLSDTALHHL